MQIEQLFNSLPTPGLLELVGAWCIHQLVITIPLLQHSAAQAVVHFQVVPQLRAMEIKKGSDRGTGTVQTPAHLRVHPGKDMGWNEP